MKLIAAFAGLLLAAQAAPGRFVQPAVPESTSKQGGIPSIVLNAEKAWAGGDALWPLATSGDLAIAHYAIRAIGRLENPANVRPLLALAQKPGIVPAAPAHAIVQSLNGFDPARDPELMASVLTWLQSVSLIDDYPRMVSIMPGPIGSIRWGTPEQVHAAEATLRRFFIWAAYDKNKGFAYTDAVRSLESLARLNARVSSFEPDTVTRLARIVANTGANDGEAARQAALAALIAARALDADTELTALRDSYEQVRRLATAVLGGSGGGLDEEQRLAAIRDKLGDRDGQVRYEAVRAYARRNAPTQGCQPLLGLLADRDAHVALAVIDALGDLCKTDDEVTARLVAEVRTPAVSAWHRETHAFVALAKRAPERAAIAMEAFTSHPSWWVRMYAARAAAAMDDLTRLDKLAYDVNDNVREEALGPLRRLKKADADAALLSALERNDVQLLRTAATLLKDSVPSERTARALLAPLLRLTKEGKETSRDARLPLLEAIDLHAGPAIALDLQPLLRDFDPIVAAKAASIVSRLTEKPAAAEPVPVTRGWAKAFDDLRRCVSVSLSSGKSFTLRMNPAAAPVTVDRFLALALRDHYYDGLTIHRIAPNFVIQGGGPGANEYAGHKEYMRDEIGARNSRGTVGLSTRGRNTADAQFFINLVDNPRLDADYTVFASVEAPDMAAVDAIQEGDVMSRLSAVRCSPTR
jgi:cyclophilin family peptidyl-prolyl cis-trans isomerase/HEAT repeat protein